jgi:hypothetical protein
MAGEEGTKESNMDFLGFSLIFLGGVWVIGGLVEFLFPDFVMRISVRFLALLGLDKRMPQSKSIGMYRFVGALAVLLGLALSVVGLFLVLWFEFGCLTVLIHQRGVV